MNKSYKEEMIEVGKKIDELVKKRKKADDASKKLRKEIGALMQKYELLTDRVYGSKPFKSEVQEI
jgi:glycine/serine hydroxymethyltransferase